MSKIEVNTIDAQCGSTITLGSSGKTVTLAPGASQTGFGRTGTVDWCTNAKTSPFSGVSGKGYFINTTSGGITVTLPSSPSAGDIVAFKDYANTFDTNNVTIGRGGSKIGGECIDATLGTEGQAVTLVYVDATKGWVNTESDTTIVGSNYVTASGGTETTSGDYKIHTFTSDGTLTITKSGTPAGSTKISYMVVGAGGGGEQTRGGGGGAGGFREGKCSSDPYSASPLAATPCSALTAGVGTFPISVGAGGAGGVRCSSVAVNGSNSIFSSITSTGGGRGGGDNGGGSQQGGSGGSGGGSYNPGTAVGAGNTPPVSPPQGNNGGLGAGAPKYGAGGGGGASAVGSNGSTSGGADGGNGIASSITGSAVTRAGGGGGGAYNTGTVGSGGSGGGGDASPGSGTPYVGDAGTTNTGSGGGGNSNLSPGAPGSGGAGGNGGSGIVVVRYKYQN